MSHWFRKPLDICVDCGETWDHPNHKRGCDGTFSGFGPGLAFCELEAGHDGPHLLHPWNGSEWLVDSVGSFVQTRPSRYESSNEETNG